MNYEEERILLKEKKNGACDSLRIFHYPQYGPGYSVEVAKENSSIGNPVAQFWFHEQSDAERLYDALCKCATSTIEERNYVLKMSPFGATL